MIASCIPLAFQQVVAAVKSRLNVYFFDLLLYIGISLVDKTEASSETQELVKGL